MWSPFRSDQVLIPHFDIWSSCLQQESYKVGLARIPWQQLMSALGNLSPLTLLTLLSAYKSSLELIVWRLSSVPHWSLFFFIAKLQNKLSLPPLTSGWLCFLWRQQVGGFPHYEDLCISCLLLIPLMRIKLTQSQGQNAFADCHWIEGDKKFYTMKNGRNCWVGNMCYSYFLSTLLLIKYNFLFPWHCC